MVSNVLLLPSIPKPTTKSGFNSSKTSVFMPSFSPSSLIFLVSIKPLTFSEDT